MFAPPGALALRSPAQRVKQGEGCCGVKGKAVGQQYQSTCITPCRVCSPPFLPVGEGGGALGFAVLAGFAGRPVPFPAPAELELLLLLLLPEPERSRVGVPAACLGAFGLPPLGGGGGGGSVPAGGGASAPPSGAGPPASGGGPCPGAAGASAGASPPAPEVALMTLPLTSSGIWDRMFVRMMSTAPGRYGESRVVERGRKELYWNQHRPPPLLTSSRGVRVICEGG